MAMLLKTSTAGRPIGVDRKSNVLRGYVVAQAGPFKTPGRGQFDGQALDSIVRLMRAAPIGLRSRFTHPGWLSDGLGKFLGRARDPWRDGDLVRANLHFDKTALDRPPLGGGKPLGQYVMDLAESDPGAFGSSLALTADKVYELDHTGRIKRDAAGEELPPIWRPQLLHASDIVDDPDASGDSILGTRTGHGGLAEIYRRRLKLKLLAARFEA